MTFLVQISKKRSISWGRISPNNTEEKNEDQFFLLCESSALHIAYELIITFLKLDK